MHRDKKTLVFCCHLNFFPKLLGCLHFCLKLTASVLEMASATNFPYQRLIYESGLDFEADDYRERERVVVNKSRSWSRFRRVHIRKRFRLKVPSMRRLILRKKFKLVSAVRLSCAKVLRRLKESQSHFGDLFSGNYLFLQVNPTSMKCIQKSYQATANELNLRGLQTSSLPRVAN